MQDLEKYDRFVTEKKVNPVLVYLKKIFGQMASSFYNPGTPLWVSGLFYLATPGPRGIYQGKILDIGCSTGTFLEFLPGAWDKYGIEINSEAVQIGRKKGLAIDSGIFEKYSSRRKFDVLRASHVVEHTRNPELFVKKLSTLTKDGGKVIIYTPNSDSFSRKIFGSYWEGFYDDTHFNIYNRRTLESLFKKYGLSASKSDTYYMGYLLSSLFRKNNIKNSRFLNAIFPLLYLFMLPLSLMRYILPDLIQGGGLYMEFVKLKRIAKK